MLALTSVSGLVPPAGPAVAVGLAPSASPPVASLINQPTLRPTEIPVRVSWPAAADSDGTIAGYELQRQKDNVYGSPWEAAGSFGATVRSVDVWLPAYVTYTFRVRARDNDGNYSTWKQGASLAVTPDQENSSRIEYLDERPADACQEPRSWRVSSHQYFYRDSVRYGSCPGMVASFKFYGDSVAWVTTLGPNRGRADIYLNGIGKGWVDLYSPTLQFRRVMFTISGLGPGLNTLNIRPRADKHASSTDTHVDIDAFVRLGATTPPVKDTSYPVPSTNVFFVDSSQGSDTNDGKTTSTAFATFKKALDVVNATTDPDPQTIVLREGTYRGTNNHVVRKRVTIQPYPHETVWIKGSDVVTGWQPEGGSRWVAPWTPLPSCDYLEVSVDNSTGDGSPAYPMARYIDVAFIDGEPLEQVNNWTDVGAETGRFFNANVDNNAGNTDCNDPGKTDYDRLYISSDPTGKTVEMSRGYDHALKIGETADGTVIRGLGFAHYGYDGVEVYQAQDVTLESNTFAWNGVAGAQVHSGTRARVYDNMLISNGRKGMHASGDYMELKWNTFVHNNYEHYRVDWDAAAVKMTRSQGVKVRDNAVEDHTAHGLWLDVNMRDAEVVRNRLQRNVFGIFFEISTDAIIASNVAVRNSAGIAVSNASWVRIWHNTLVSNGKALYIKDTERAPEDEAAKQIQEDRDAIALRSNPPYWDLYWETRKVYVKNNIHSNATDPSAVVRLEHGGCAGTQDPSACVADQPMVGDMDRNAYYRTDTTQPDNVLWWQQKATVPAKGYLTLGAFRSDSNNHFPESSANSPFEENGIESASSSTNPFFLSEAEEDYRQKAGSPAINAGEAWPVDGNGISYIRDAIYYDYATKPSDAAPNMGMLVLPAR